MMSATEGRRGKAALTSRVRDAVSKGASDAEAWQTATLFLAHAMLPEYAVRASVGLNHAGALPIKGSISTEDPQPQQKSYPCLSSISQRNSGSLIRVQGLEKM